MAYDKIVDSTVLDAGLKTIADAIREKGGTSDNLTFPAAFAEAIAAIEAGGGGEVALFGRKVITGSFVLASDTTAASTTLMETMGLFEANKAYSVFMEALGPFVNVGATFGNKAMIASVSKRYNTSNNNTEETAYCLDDYKSATTQKYGLQKPYRNNHLVLRCSSKAIAKAGIEYSWIAIEEGA